RHGGLRRFARRALRSLQRRPGRDRGAGRRARPRTASEHVVSGEQELAGLRVVVTREARESEAFADRLRALGAEPVVCPALEIRFRNPPGFHDALLALERFDWVVFTSANAVRAVAERCAALGIDPARGLARPKVAAVGEPTANTLRALVVQVDLVPDL